MRKQTAVVIKAYSSAKARAEGGEPLEPKTVYDVFDFDQYVAQHSFPAKHLAFEDGEGKPLSTHDIARATLFTA